MTQGRVKCVILGGFLLHLRAFPPRVGAADTPPPTPIGQGHGVLFELTVVAPCSRLIFFHVLCFSFRTAQSAKSKKDQMISTTMVPACPHCGSERLQKNGHTPRGAQRARCVECARTFTLSPKGPRHTRTFKEPVLAADQDRMSLRGIHRTFGVCYASVLRWLGGKTEDLPACKDTLLPSQDGDVLELDELWSFVQKKAQTLWRWVALCRRTRQIVAWSLGDRSEEAAADLRAALPKDYRRRATRSDPWRAYAAAFPKRAHRCCAKREGQTCHVER